MISYYGALILILILFILLNFIVSELVVMLNFFDIEILIKLVTK